MSGSRLQFVDTNILIYAHDSSAGVKQQRARELLRELWETRTGCLSIQVLQEFYVNVTRKVPVPLTLDGAAQIVSDLAAWQIHQPDVSDVLDAIQMQSRFQLSFWDAMILTSARALKCTTLWSEDLNQGQDIAGVKIRSPF